MSKPLKILGADVVDAKPLSGGFTSKGALKAITDSGRVYFCKTSERPTTTFHEEAQGLAEIAHYKAIRCPHVIEVDNQKLVLEWIEPEPVTPQFWSQFGYRLARLHIQLHEQFGFPIHNHIGATPQLNPLRSTEDLSWADWFIEFRLRTMLEHPTWRGDREMHNLFQRAEPILHHHLARVQEPPSLVHGDLWHGNFICTHEQTPVLVDPAPYYGHREVDLAMADLFGGFTPEFFQAYHQEFPLQPGYDDRKNIYNLYHLMNHWILFGGNYRRQSVEVLQRLLMS